MHPPRSNATPMFDDLDQILRETNSTVLRDHVKDYLLQMIPFTGNKVEQMMQPGKDTTGVESPRRRRTPQDSLTENLPEGDVVFDLDWAFEIVLPLLQGGEVGDLIGEKLVESAQVHFSRETLLMELDFSCTESAPIETIVVGDIHGQFCDLIRIFDSFGRPGPDRRYIFNGDVVDRGPRSVACWLFLCALKTAVPDFLFVTRGNHETRTISVHDSTFARECMNSYSKKFYLQCQRAFDELPVSYVLNKSIFITHGGLPKNLCLERLRRMPKDRSYSIYDNRTVMALLWNDPTNSKGYNRNIRGPNVFSFGPDITESFLAKHNLSLLIRSHECKIFGHQYTHNSKCLTVFSCPNYQSIGNSGAVALVNSRGEVKIAQF